MASQKRIENTFLCFLQDNSSVQEIEKNIQNFVPLDWHNLYELAMRKGLYPVLYSRILNYPGIPTDFILKLKNIFLANMKINIGAYRRALEVLGFLKENRISVVPLKGPISALYLYGDLALRRNSCDLDLLVKKEDFEQSRNLLEAMGYGSSKNKQKLRLKYERQLCFAKGDAHGKPLLLDLHYDLHGLFTYAKAEDFWRGTRDIDFDGNKILMPSNEDLIIYLSLVCMTITEFIELRYVYDIRTLINKFYNQIAWNDLAHRLNNHRHKHCVFFALKLAKELFAAEIPRDFMDRIKPNIFKSIILQAWINKQNVLRNWDYAGSRWYLFFMPWHYFISSYLYSRNIFDCIKIVFAKIFMPVDDIAAIYNLKPSYFLYAKRLFRPFRRFSGKEYTRFIHL